VTEPQPQNANAGPDDEGLLLGQIAETNYDTFEESPAETDDERTYSQDTTFTQYGDLQLLTNGPTVERVQPEAANPVVGQSPTFDNPDEDKDNFYLLGISGYYVGRKYRIKKGITRIGRDKRLNDIVVKKNLSGKLDKSVSRRQASIIYRKGQYTLLDKRGRSHTWLNKTKIEMSKELQLEAGDEIEIISDRQNHIFRFVREGDWDFSFPQRAGAWHLRHRLGVLNGFTACVAIVALILISTSAMTLRQINGGPGKLKIKESLWGMPHANGSTPSESSAAMADLNQDNHPEIIYISQTGELIALDGLTKQPMWKVSDSQANADYGVTVADLYNRGNPYVIVVTDDGRVRAIEGNLGIESWHSEILPSLIGPPVVADFNGDRAKDIAVVSEDNTLSVWYLGPNVSRWKHGLNKLITSGLSAADLSGDGIADILAGTADGEILIFDGLAEKLWREINVNDELAKATGNQTGNHSITIPIASGDFNNDGMPDLVAMTSLGWTIAFSGGTFDRFWYLEPRSDSSVEARNPALAIGDMDGDQNHDVLILTADAQLRVVQGLGTSDDQSMLMWEFPKTFGLNGNTSNPVLVDFNKNGTEDVGIDLGGSFVVFEGTTGEQLLSQRLGNGVSFSQPLVGDLDSDNQTDIVLRKMDGQFYKLETNRLSLPGEVIWGQYLGTSTHVGRSEYEIPKTGNHYMLILVSVIMTLAVAGLQVLVRTNRAKLAYY
jgi:outer membrane protein assembly factor BamB